jgi:phosphatidate cytidylyltransferase
MSTLTKRVITALVLGAIVLLTLFYLPPVAARVLLGLFLLMGAWEWSGFCWQTNLIARVFYVALLVVMAALLGFDLLSVLPVSTVLWLATVWWVLAGGWMLTGHSKASRPLCMVAGVFALVPAWYAVMYLLAQDNGAWLFVWAVLVVAAADIGAYFFGRSLGRNKLVPAISPGKTIEGLLGGAVCAAIATASGAWVLEGNWLIAGLMGLLLALLSVVGDLSVSVFKRSAGLKDSGWILPGHGGVMDRIDALVAVLPVFVLLLGVAGVVSV